MQDQESVSRGQNPKTSIQDYSNLANHQIQNMTVQGELQNFTTTLLCFIWKFYSKTLHSPIATFIIDYCSYQMLSSFLY